MTASTTWPPRSIRRTAETVDPARARRYLERYLQTDRVSVFWGTVDDFAARLQRAWDESEE